MQQRWCKMTHHHHRSSILPFFTLLFAVIVASCLCGPTHANITANASSSTVLNNAVSAELTPPTPAPAAAASSPVARGRYAWVMMHYEGTPKDDEYLLGLRVLIRSIKDTKTPHDIVVIVSDNVRQSTKDQLVADGALLNEVANIKNPFETRVTGRNSYKARFIYSLNKLYIWKMTEYDRVVFLDSDNVFLSNMDDLFLCGHFCVVYMNPLIFHTGLIVVKPDETMFEKLIAALYSDASFSHDGADQGFLVAQFDIEHAPLFLPSVQRSLGKPSDEPAMRLNIGWNLNHFWYYIAFNWEWFFMAEEQEKTGVGAQADDSSATTAAATSQSSNPSASDDAYPWIHEYARMSESERKYAVAGSSLAYCSGMMLKPWYWFPTMYFNHHYHWHTQREKLNIDYTPILFSRLALFVPVWIIYSFLLARSRTLVSVSNAFEKLRSMCIRTLATSPVFIGYLVGFACWMCAAVLAFNLIPYVTPPRMAWTIWSVWHVGSMYMMLGLWTHFILRPSTASNKAAGTVKDVFGDEEKIENTINAVCGRSALVLLCVGQGLFFLSWLDVFPIFIVKIGAFQYLLMMWMGIQMHVFRRATERMCQLHQSRKAQL